MTHGLRVRAGAHGIPTRLRELLTNRPNTQLIQDRALRTIADFLTHLDTTPGLSLPAGNHFIGSHGFDRAWIQIQLDQTQTTPRDYEAVSAAVPGASDPFNTNVTAGSIAIPNRVNHDAQGHLGTMATNLRGCRIGVSGPFVDKRCPSPP